MHIFKEVHHMPQQEYIVRLECVSDCRERDVHEVEDVCVWNLSRNMFQNDDQLAYLTYRQTVNSNYVQEY